MAAQGVMFDLDGTLILSDRQLGQYRLLPHAVEVLEHLQARGVPFLALTNGSAYPARAQAPRLAPHREAMTDVIAKALGIGRASVNVKAKTAEKLGPVGQGLSMEARAVVLLHRAAPPSGAKVLSADGGVAT